MKLLQTFFISCCFLFALNAGFSQVQLENLSFEKALKKAKKEEKILMVVIDSKSCDKCNEVAKQGLANENTFAINKLAVAIELAVDNPDWDFLSKKYFKEPASQFGVLFFNDKGILVHRYDKSTSNGSGYLTEVNAALQNINLPAEVEKLDATVKTSGFTDLKMVDELIKKRRLMQLPTEDLLDAFIKAAPADSLSGFRYFQTLARFAPVLNTKADSLLRHNLNFNRYWYLIDSKERVAINQEILNKTWRKAVADKDYLLESRLADFSGAIHENATAKSKSISRVYHLQSFYKAVKDTSEFLRFAAIYVDENLMKLTLDSISRLNNKNILSTSKKMMDSIPTTSAKQVFTTVNTLYTPLYFSGQLNNFAWDFYKMSSDSTDWKHALVWAKKAMEFYETPELLDTYAQLLYVTGNRDEAIIQEAKVIEKKKLAGREKDIAVTERVLERMRNGAAKVAD